MREGVLAVEVVVEAVLNRRPDSQLGFRKESCHRQRQQVGRTVAVNLKRFQILVRQNRKRRILLDRPRKIGQLTIHFRNNRRFCQPFPNRIGNL